MQSNMTPSNLEQGSPLNFQPVALDSCSKIAGGNTWMVDTFQMPGLRCHLFSRPSHGADAGGDIFYATACGIEAKSKFLLVDTVGHGEEASVLSSQLLDVLGPVADRPCNKDMLIDLNAMLCESTAVSIFATASAATFNRDEKSLTYAYAGHPNMLLHRDGEWNELRPAGESTFPVGIICNTPYHQTKTSLHPGDWVLMYSDGVLDVAGQSTGTYTPASLVRLASRIATRRSEIFFQEFLFLLATENQGTHFDDDVTFILIEVSEAI